MKKSVGSRRVVYFVQSVNGGPVKIGRTASDVRKRLMSLQTGRADKLIIIATTDGFSEKEVHERFRPWRISGEWFLPSATMLQWIQAHARATSRGNRAMAEWPFSKDYESEIARLHELIMGFADRMVLMSETLSDLVQVQREGLHL